MTATQKFGYQENDKNISRYMKIYANILNFIKFGVKAY